MTFDWSAYAYIEWGGNVVCVRKIRNGKREKWHLPGGKREPMEFDPRRTLIRELEEETGIKIEMHQAPRKPAFRQKRKILKDRGNDKTYAHQYDDYFYRVTPSREQFEGLHTGTDEEEVGMIPRGKIATMEDFKKYHSKILEDYFQE